MVHKSEAYKKVIKEKPLTISEQMVLLKQYYGCLIEKAEIQNNELICVLVLQPSEESSIYKIKITYKSSDYCPKAWLLKPRITAEEARRLHHVYERDNDGNLRLCVYYPGYKEWSPELNISDSFVPWIITWLNTYEYWTITGEWTYFESPRRITEKDKKDEHRRFCI